MTVLGPIPSEEAGITLVHEHVFFDHSRSFHYSETATAKGLLNKPVEMSMLGLLRRRPTGTTLDNVILSDQDTAIAELGRFQREGGGLVVDCTVDGLGRDPAALRRVARATGIHVVQGTGFYTERSHPAWVKDWTIDQLAQLFIEHIQVGIDDTGVKAGILGEIGTSLVPGDAGPTAVMTPAEERVLRAAGRAAVATGVAVSVHVDVRGKGAVQVIDVLAQEGLPPDRMIMGHMDIPMDLDYHLAVAARGVFLAYDEFGRDYYSDEVGVSRPSDVTRIEYLQSLIRAGYEDQVLLSHDVCLKMDLRRYGGNGYDHILVSVLPMFRRAGLSEGQIAKLLVHNPRRALEFDLP